MRLLFLKNKNIPRCCLFTSMFRISIVIYGLLFFCSSEVAAEATIQAPNKDCISCHRQKTAATVQQWEESAHARANVGCADCHGTDHAAIEKGDQRVATTTCGKCHPKAYQTHTASRHGMGLHSGWGCTRNLPNRDSRECAFCHDKDSSKILSTVHCARFLKQSVEMAEIGCNRCHQVESSCSSCHTGHITDLKVVRDPNVCAVCHMGPDHPQWEMWQTSRHGTLHATRGDQNGPSCQTCHMPGGSHDVSRGITMSSGMTSYPAVTATKERATMLERCSSCHAPAVARRELERNDAVHRQSLKLVKEAEEIVARLYDEKLLVPMPEHRPSHPLSGNTLVLDNQMLYEDTSHIERLLFKMKKYDLAKTVKGAYHQNPAYSHWYGNAELKMDLVDIRSEARRLREQIKSPSTPTAVSPVDKTGNELELIRKKLERGNISPDDARQERKKLIEQYLLER